MRRHQRLLGAVGVAAAAATLLAGCSSGGANNSGQGNGGGGSSGSAGGSQSQASGSDQNVQPAFNAATIGYVNKTTQPTGGTLKLLATGDCDSWDPANTYYGWCFNMQRLFTRTLVGYSSLPGSNNAGGLKPDLATGMGQHNSDYTQWTYKLQPGLKYADGTPISSKDIKHGLSRLFATDVINGGPSSYYLDILKAPAGYAGPYKGGGDLDSIQTPDDQTIIFNLKKPYADFDYLMALPAAAPVPAAKDDGAQYTNHPVSSGPYKIDNYSPGKSISFSKNPNWSKSTDQIRTPLVDNVTLTIDSDADDIDRRLQAGDADARADQGVQPSFQSKIDSDPNLKKNADDPATGLTYYIPVMQTVKPFDNVHCRRAVQYALNKRALLSAVGGTYGGKIANTMTPPSIPGYDANFNPYPNGADNTGNLTQAKSELQQCGQPNGFSTKMAYVNKGREPAIFNAVQVALKRVGIDVQSAIGDQATYYSKFIGSPQNIVSQGIGLAYAGWGADFPTGLGFWNSIANGNNILPTGNSDYPSLNDPVVNQVLANAATESGQHSADFKKLDQQVMQDAVYAPYVYGATLYYRNPEMVNVTCNYSVAFGIYDFVNVGVKKS